MFKVAFRKINLGMMSQTQQETEGKILKAKSVAMGTLM